MTTLKQKGSGLMPCILWILLIVNTIGLAYYIYLNHVESKQIPNLVGTWRGTNLTVSDLKGYKVWGTKTITITEQQDRRFRGSFTYPEGTKNFFGVIYPDNKSFTWVNSDSLGYNQGRILSNNSIAACYVESGQQATAGCATLARQ